MIGRIDAASSIAVAPRSHEGAEMPKDGDRDRVRLELDLADDPRRPVVFAAHADVSASPPRGVDGLATGAAATACGRSSPLRNYAAA